jgi:dihydroxyacetone kinase-like protein
MMDVLIPVAERFTAMADALASKKEILEALPRIAEESMLATRDMLATKGRASFLGERSRGHVDPGARSSQLMIEAVCARLAQGDA